MSGKSPRKEGKGKPKQPPKQAAPVSKEPVKDALKKKK
jgi:hypothetical protein